MAVVVHFDGLCDPNPGGVCAYGFTIDRDGKRVLGECGLTEESGTPAATNNVAEWTGLVRALERVKELGLDREPLTVHGDSELVIRQVTGEYRVRKRELKPFYEQASMLRMGLNARFEWVPREQNKDADALCWKATKSTKTDATKSAKKKS